MSTLLNQIAALRTSLRDADGNDPDSFSNVFARFFDISEGANLMSASKSIEDRVVVALIESTARRHLRDPAFSLSMIRVLQHQESGLTHGGFVAGNTVGTFFWFAADERGLVAFSDGSAMMHYYRITAAVLQARGVPTPRPSGKQ